MFKENMECPSSPHPHFFSVKKSFGLQPLLLFLKKPRWLFVADQIYGLGNEYFITFIKGVYDWNSACGNRLVYIWEVPASTESRPTCPFVLGRLRWAVKAAGAVVAVARVLFYASGLFSYHAGIWCRAILHHCLNALKGWADSALWSCF